MSALAERYGWPLDVQDLVKGLVRDAVLAENARAVAALRRRARFLLNFGDEYDPLIADALNSAADELEGRP